MDHRIRRVATAAVLTALGTACAGDLGAEQGTLPTCNASPNDPPVYERSAVEKVEGSDHAGHRYAYLGPNGEELEYLYGIASDAGAGLPQVAQLPLASVGAGRLLGSGDEWAFVWDGEFPCTSMSVTGSGIARKDFVTLLGYTGVIPAPEEEEGEGGEVEGEVQEELEEEEGEVEEGILPPGGPSVEFVAIFATAPEPGGIEPYREGLTEAAGDNAWFGAVHCWKSLASRLGVPRDRWAAGISALTRNELDFYIERYDRVPIFSGQLKHAAACEPAG
jgi:hypothetical protein